MERLPIYIQGGFVLTTFFTVVLLVKACGPATRVVVVLIVWLLLQAILSLSGFYLADAAQPRFLAMVAPPMGLILTLFMVPQAKEFLDRVDQRYLTLLHMVRIPVELVLFGLYMHNAIPELMTFEGRNFDIVSGLTAPFVFYFGYVHVKISKRTVLWWNIGCLVLLLNIVVHAMLSAPSPFQQLAFQQPNIAIFYFPFNWLPSFVVPVVLFSHLVCIRQLMKKQS
jgi:hypothetical protein